MRFSPTVAAASLALTATLIASPVHAAPILGTTGAGLQNAGAPQENSGRFWDGNSWDSNSLLDGAGASNPCNIGSLASGTELRPQRDGRWRRHPLRPGAAAISRWPRAGWASRPGVTATARPT